MEQRKILYRGVDEKTGKWVNGMPMSFKGLGFITDGELALAGDFWAIQAHEILSDSLCEYTSLIDANNNMIWENDIVKIRWHDGLEMIHTVAQIVWCDAARNNDRTKHGGELGTHTNGCWVFCDRKRRDHMLSSWMTYEVVGSAVLDPYWFDLSIPCLIKSMQQATKK